MLNNNENIDFCYINKYVYVYYIIELITIQIEKIRC